MRVSDVRENGLIETQPYYQDGGCGQIKTITATKQNKSQTGSGQQTHFHRLAICYTARLGRKGCGQSDGEVVGGQQGAEAFVSMTTKARKGEPTAPRITLSAYC